MLKLVSWRDQKNTKHNAKRQRSAARDACFKFVSLEVTKSLGGLFKYQSHIRAYTYTTNSLAELRLGGQRFTQAEKHNLANTDARIIKLAAARAVCRCLCLVTVNKLPMATEHACISHSTASLDC